MVNTISYFFDWRFYRFTGISKIIGVTANLIFIVKFHVFKKKYVISLFACLAILSICFIVSQLFLKNINVIQNLQSNFIYYLTACFLPIYLITFFSIDKFTTLKALNLLKSLFWLNAIFIIIGICLEVKWFQTYYYYATRFGYKGIMERSTYVSYLFIFMIVYYYYNWSSIKKKKTLWCLIATICISFLVGTKRLYAFVILLFVFHFFAAKLYKNWWFYVVFCVFSLSLYVFRDFILIGFNSGFQVFSTIYEDKGLISALTSFRNELLLEYKLQFIDGHWTFFNYIFGGGFFQLIRPEMDLIDSYLFFGVFGPILYLYIYKMYIFNFKIKNSIVMFLVVLIVILAVFSSGIIFSADFALPLILFSSYFYYEHQTKNK